MDVVILLMCMKDVCVFGVPGYLAVVGITAYLSMYLRG